jgi:hypothetical protein
LGRFAHQVFAEAPARARGRRNKAKRRSTGYGMPNAMRQVAAHDGTLEMEAWPAGTRLGGVRRG